jgi:hypothetical protein
MKKTLFILAFVLASTTLLQAQKPTIGIHAGATMANYKIESMGVNIDADSKAGFMVGVMADWKISKNISFQPALNYLQKGGIVNMESDMGEGGMESMKTTLNLNYLELPLNFLYNFDTKGGNFFIGAGPSFSYGLSGKYKTEYSGETMEEDINFGTSEEDDLKPFDFGINFLTGYQFKKGFVVSFNYTPGMTNLSNDSEVTWKNNYFGLSVGYFLQKKTAK